MDLCVFSFQIHIQTERQLEVESEFIPELLFFQFQSGLAVK